MVVLALTCAAASGAAAGTPVAYAAAPEAPETLPASSVNETSAALNGTLNPKATEPSTVGWFFEYNKGSSCTGGQNTPLKSQAEAKATPVSAEISGLSPGSQYAACLVAASASEQTVGNVVTFATPTHLSPWWGVTSGARPTNLQPGVAKSEVQGIVTSREVAFKLLAGGKRVGTFFVTEPYFKKFGEAYPKATAANIQEALEGFEAYGPGTVVTGGELEEGKRLIITTPLGKPVPKLEVAAVFGEGKATVLSEGRPDGEIVVSAENRGDAATSGKVTIADQLPPGLQAVGIEAIAGGEGGFFNRGPVECSLATLRCTFEGVFENVKGEIVPKTLPPFEVIEARISVVVNGAKSGELNTAAVSGGGASRPASASRAIEVAGTGRFGFEDYQLVPENPGGSIDTQAGSHPFQLTNVVTLNSQTPEFSLVRGEVLPRSFGLPRDIIAELPTGFVGNPTPFARCTEAQFNKHGVAQGTNECPPQSAIGVATVTVNEPIILGLDTLTSPIFNMVPRVGEPARFAFKPGPVPVFLDTSVRTGSDYGVTVTSSNTTQLAWLLSAKLTFWGVPGDPRHDSQRGWACLDELPSCQSTNATSPPPFLVMPTSCEQPFETTLRGDSWPAEGKPSEQAEPVTYPRPPEQLKLDGCNHLQFEPSVKVTPDGTAASSPTGLNVDVHVPQTSVLHAESLAESAVRGISVALPEGVAVNPSGGDGLQACTEGQIGFAGVEAGGLERDLFTQTLGEPFCPTGSKIGTVKIKTPLLPNPLEGAVYLATQNENPFSSLIALYIVAEDPVSGTLVKLPGETHLTPSGQVIGTFKNNPELPFEDAELHFFGGERAPLATPARCGPYTSNATFTPWSGNEPVSSTSTFNITSGPNNTPCPGASLPFSPTLKGGTTNINAGAFSPLTTTIGREDGNQDMQSVQLHMPPGLSGLLSGVKLCPEAQANEGTCGPESLIGETIVSAGVGSDPVSVKGGRVYITEKYAGAPFGLSVVNPVKAGPFDLERDTSNPAQNPPCDCVVVRAKIEVDPITAALTVTTDPTGPHAIPHLIDGIPVQIKRVNVTINRPNFTFNPTNCNPMSLTGTIASDEGASSPVSVPFQATNCAVLRFAPKFSVSTSAKTSKALGASLTARVAEPPGSMGTQANITRVKVDLPIQLPSRLTTLQKACLDKVFEANPANCPAASAIGHASVTTPLLPVPLTGPAIFVSHGGEAFPSLTMVLQGYGVTVDLVGSTFINKKGITSTTFKTVPDVPFNTFELTLPQGKYSALGANLPAKAHNSFCGQNLKMPTLFVAQNGLELHQQTPITVTGCPKHRKARKARKGRRAARHNRHK
jgi:hypothetical protein